MNQSPNLKSVRILIFVLLVSSVVAGCTQLRLPTNQTTPPATAQSTVKVSPTSSTTKTINSSDWINLLPGETHGNLPLQKRKR